MDLETALQDFQSKNYFVWDDFLSPSEAALITLDYQKLYREGSFHAAGTGNKAGAQYLNATIRSDESCWLDPLALTLSQSIFWDRLEGIKKALNEYFYLGLWSLEGQYSRYPVDGFYQKHLDRFSNDDQRTVSAVLYFNQAWAQGDGGELRIHQSAHEKMDLAPTSGRLICFLSSQVIHEVLSSHKIRLSFAGWWKTRSA